MGVELHPSSGSTKKRRGSADSQDPSALQKAALRLMTRAHAVVYRLSEGKILGNLPGPESRKNPVLLLTTIGRKSGKERTIPLLYLTDDDGFVVVASGGGPYRDPPWVHNLLAAGMALARIANEEREVFPERVTGEERAKLWPKLIQMLPRWEQMQRQTARELSVIRLRPTAPGEWSLEEEPSVRSF